jgi:hypothetical protein
MRSPSPRLGPTLTRRSLALKTALLSAPASDIAAIAFAPHDQATGRMAIGKLVARGQRIIFGDRLRKLAMRLLAFLVLGTVGCTGLAPSDRVDLRTDRASYQLPSADLAVTVTNRADVPLHWVACPSPFWTERRELAGWVRDSRPAVLCANNLPTIDLQPDGTYLATVWIPGRAGVYRVGFAAALGTADLVSAHSAPFAVVAP